MYSLSDSICVLLLVVVVVVVVVCINTPVVPRPGAMGAGQTGEAASL